MSRDKPDTGGRTDGGSAKGGMSRRELLKGSVKAMPVVLTLHSGAALARSSNVITGTDSVDIDGKYRCLDTRGIRPLSRRDQIYDLGARPRPAVVTVMEHRDYYYGMPVDGTDDGHEDRPERQWGNRRWRNKWEARKAGSRIVSPREMCERGGEYAYFEGGEWHSVRLPRRGGMLVSSTALSSFAGNIRVDQEF